VIKQSKGVRLIGRQASAAKPIGAKRLERNEQRPGVAAGYSAPIGSSRTPESDRSSQTCGFALGAREAIASDSANMRV
jgi:hypothetical protein